MPYKDKEKALQCARDSQRRRYWDNPRKFIDYVLARRKERCDADPEFRRALLDANNASNRKSRALKRKRRGNRTIAQIVADARERAAIIARDRGYGIIRKEFK